MQQTPLEADIGFSESWLTLREPADHLARNVSLNDPLTTWFKQQSTHYVLELGAGTGSNLRYLMPQMGHDQHWLLLDNDVALFTCLPDRLKVWANKQNASVRAENNRYIVEHENFSATIECKVINLASELDQIPVDKVQLITASALLDLTSAEWLNQLAALIHRHRCACLFALNYNGKIQWQPEHDADSMVSALLNQHQLNDKGFGKALGPRAGHYFAQTLKKTGRQVMTGESDWLIMPESHELQLAIVDGWAPAALEQDNDANRATIQQWHIGRKQTIDQRQTALTVGHIDVLSLPFGRTTAG